MAGMPVRRMRNNPKAWPSSCAPFTVVFRLREKGKPAIQEVGLSLGAVPQVGSKINFEGSDLPAGVLYSYYRVYDIYWKYTDYGSVVYVDAVKADVYSKFRDWASGEQVQLR